MSEPNEPDQPGSEKPEADKGHTRRVRKLGDRISEARHLRGLIRDPDLQAVEMERNGRRTLIGLWFFLSLGLVFTTAGVQRFLAGKATMAEPLWWAAWTVEPMFAGLLIVLLNFEAVILSHGIQPDHEWWSRLKHVLLASTMAMNVIPQIMPLATGRWEAFNLGSAAVHAIIPVIVYGIAEVIPVIQARQREVILAAYEASDAATPPEPESQREPDVERTVTMPAVTPEPPPARPKPEPKGTAAKLPAEMVQAVSDAWERAKNEGREITTADIRRATRVPEPMAAQILADLQVNNGHAFA
ncbi:hypothetical protein GCM10009854_13200 [Saccharopolyspora halophila]|uniref:DUF2637 domain-containing protein n=1 Tax=Saccharopolyspora halophila TaxID=405551 RepID=A0ABN3FVE1_9PSEU